MRTILSALALIPLLTGALPANEAEMIGPEEAVFASGEAASAENGTVWDGFTRARFVLRFLSIIPGQGTPPAGVDGDNAANSPGWAIIPARNRSHLIQLPQIARVVSGERAHWSVVFSASASASASARDFASLDWYQPGLKLPFTILYHPEPTQTTAESATVRFYISGGTFSNLGGAVNLPQFDVNLYGTPPAYDAAEFALDALPASPITGPLVTVDPHNPSRALLTLSGTADTAHAGQIVYVRHRHSTALDGSRYWSTFVPLATVGGNGSWSGRALLPPAAAIELDLILAATDGSQYRAHVPIVEILDAEDAVDGDYASKAGDGIANLLKLAVGLDPATRAMQSDFMQIETVEIGGITYGQIRYQRDPSQTSIQLTPQWTPDYKASPWRSGGLIHSLISTDPVSGIQTWTARAPLGGSSAYLRLCATRKAAPPRLLEAIPPDLALSLHAVSNQAAHIIRIRRSSDNAEQDFAAHELRNGALVSWVGPGNDGFVSVWYDQSGEGRHAAQTDPSRQPRLVHNGAIVLDQSGNMAIDFEPDATATWLLLAAPVLHRSSFWALDLQAKGLTTPIVQNALITNTVIGSARSYLFFAAADQNYALSLDSTSPSVTGSWWQNGMFMDHGTNVGANGSEIRTAASLQTAIYDAGYPLDAGAVIGRINNNPDHNHSGTISEVIIYDTDQSANRAAIEADIAERWGIELAP